ncbi:MAG TPA: DUF2865 domain-containing protein [Xanthobacteraceae bacterium]|jgi:hypothetical protein|nr:DUF2865 domain-containing protein [Xanthobacteraceae bacterium]
MIPRPLRKLGLAALVASAASTQPLTAPALAQGYPQSPNGQARSPACPQLESQLSAFDRGITDSTQSDQAKRLDDAARKQQSDLDRLTAQARRSGCEGNGFFSLFVSQPAQCGPLNAQIQQARANLDRTMNDLQRAQSNTGADHESQRRSIIGALAQNDCGPQYRQQVNQGGGFFDRLFGPGTILNPDTGPAPASGTYKTLCVRTCDGFYFPVSYSALPNRFAEDAQACQRLCPASEVALYSHRSSGEDVNQAVSTASGRPYTELPNAFAYRKQFNPSCSCKAAGQTWADALKQLDDQTVERGDIVVNTEERAKQLAQPQTDAQGKPIKPTPPARGGAAQPPPATPAAASANAADTTDTDTSKRKVRAVGPTFLPAH